MLLSVESTNIKSIYGNGVFFKVKLLQKITGILKSS